MAKQQTMDQHFQQVKSRGLNSVPTTKSFYGKKEISPLKEYLASNVRSEPEVYTPTVKKLISFSSDESESDSDSENFLAVKRRIEIDESENLGVSPRKRASPSKRTTLRAKVSTPSTPRQRATVAKPKTPSTHLAELEIGTPKKSKTPGTRKQLFANKYQEARLALHSSHPENLVGREKEVADLLAFVSGHIENKTSGSIYLTGPPGTGKTAALTQICKDLPKSLNQIYVNCTSLKVPNAIYGKIGEELKLKVEKKDMKGEIERYFRSGQTRRKPILLVLDEIDNLESKNQSVLYTIFEWPSIAKSKLILVGIANTLDLTDRILPRLQARCEVKPQVMHFAPYTNNQIVSIITDRLQQANVGEIFTNNALNLLARKVSAISGDIRKTLDICRRLFEFAETQRNAMALQSNDSNEVAKVDIKEVMTILSHVYGGSQNIDDAEDKFPLQQKFLLCCLMLLLNKGKQKEITIGRLYSVYRKVCQKRKMNIVDNSEFVTLCSLIETRGIIRIITKKDAIMSKILLEWDQDQLNAALSDKNLTSDIINDVSCL